MTRKERMERLGLVLPPMPDPAACYVPGVVSGELVFTAGQTPKEGTELKFKGKLGAALTVTEGAEAAKLAALRCLSVIEHHAGGLENVCQIVKMTGYVNAVPEFTAHSKVIDGASELIEKVFGESGKHARIAVGVASLPGDAAVEIEMVVRIVSGEE